MGADSVKNVIAPKYQMDNRLQVEREMEVPPASTFMGLGSDPTPYAGIKHYRRFYPKELELCPEIMPEPSPFDSYPLMRGQSRGAAKSFWPFGGA